MTDTLADLHIVKGSGEIVFFLIILIWIIAGLMKKAAEASKRSFPQGSAKPQRPTQSPIPGGGRPSLSDFLKRIQQMAEHPEEPAPPPYAEPETPPSQPFLQMPSPPQRSPQRKAPAAGPSVLRMPTMKPVKKDVRVSPRAEREAPQRLEPIEASVESVLTGELAAPLLSEGQQLDVQEIMRFQERHIARTLGIALSTHEMKKGIILAEILGPPKAVRHRRHLSAGR